MRVSNLVHTRRTIDLKSSDYRMLNNFRKEHGDTVRTGMYDLISANFGLIPPASVYSV